MKNSTKDIDLPLKEHLNEIGNYVPQNVVEKYTNKIYTIDEEFTGFQKKLIPTEPLIEGEQYRFHFNAGKCIGCECCVVACNEQNNNPASVNWRRVGEIEAGKFPDTRRFYLSMGCNHCIAPSCLKGCPTNAYEKDIKTGIVRHKADSCIGCGYCQWNCPYSVPQFNSERKIVTKCDMCYGRLAEGNAPACVEACPENAIEIERVNINEWTVNHESGNAPGLPNSDYTISTTRITLPKKMPSSTHAVNAYRYSPEHSHPTLVMFLNFSQMSVGGFIILWLLDMYKQFILKSPLQEDMGILISLSMLFVSTLALGTAMFHLGRPIHAFKALKMWKRSWLSREVLLFTLFSGLAFAYASLWFTENVFGFLQFPGELRIIIGSLVAIFGLAGVISSAYIYMVPARPSWNTPNTPLSFIITTFILGPTFASFIMIFGNLGKGISHINHSYLFILYEIVIFSALLKLFILISTYYHMKQSRSLELNGTATLLSTHFKWQYGGRLITLALGGVLLPVLSIIQISNQGNIAVLMGLSIAQFIIMTFSEILGRYLFFVTVIPKNMAGNYFSKR